MKMKRTFGLATTIIAVLAFGSIAMAKAPKMKPGKTSTPTAAAAVKDKTGKTRTVSHKKRGRKHRHTSARHSAANMKSSTKTAAIRKS